MFTAPVAAADAFADGASSDDDDDDDDDGGEKRRKGQRKGGRGGHGRRDSSGWCWVRSRRVRSLVRTQSRDVVPLFLDFMHRDFYAHADDADVGELRLDLHLASMKESSEPSASSSSSSANDGPAKVVFELLGDDGGAVTTGADQEDAAAPAAATEQPLLSSREVWSRLTGWLEALAAAGSPRQLFHGSDVLRQVYLRLLAKPRPDASGLALECLLQYRLPFLTPYGGSVAALLSTSAVGGAAASKLGGAGGEGGGKQGGGKGRAGQTNQQRNSQGQLRDQLVLFNISRSAAAEASEADADAAARANAFASADAAASSSLIASSGGGSGGGYGGGAGNNKSAATFVDPSHRRGLVPLLARVCYGRMVARGSHRSSGARGSSKDSPASRRAAVMAFLSQLDGPKELQHFVYLMLRPFVPRGQSLCCGDHFGSGAGVGGGGGSAGGSRSGGSIGSGNGFFGHNATSATFDAELLAAEAAVVEQALRSITSFGGGGGGVRVIGSDRGAVSRQMGFLHLLHALVAKLGHHCLPFLKHFMAVMLAILDQSTAAVAASVIGEDDDDDENENENGNEDEDEDDDDDNEDNEEEDDEKKSAAASLRRSKSNGDASSRARALRCVSTELVLHFGGSSSSTYPASLTSSSSSSSLSSSSLKKIGQHER